MTQITQTLTVGERRLWATVPLSTGFYLADLVKAVVQCADTDERRSAIAHVADLLVESCADDHQWEQSISVLASLCRSHPDSYKESGTWYDGDSSITALALAMEAARMAVCKQHPLVYDESVVAEHTFKVLKYAFRAMAQNPETAMSCLKWIEQNIKLAPSRREEGR